MTILPLILGTVLGMVFAASSLYLVLKVGLTVSASIPVAVISVTFFRIFSRLGGRNATILENNITQTAGSAGESIAFGIGATMPAILILGYDLEITRVMLVAILGGLLGILMMIPLRHALIVEEHGRLKYPEGTACAEVLKAAASPESQAAAGETALAAAGPETVSGAHVIFAGFGIGLAYKTLMLVVKGWKEIPEKIFTRVYNGGSLSAEISPELLGVGYIIGPAISATLCAGGILAYLVLIPAIKFFGSGLAEPLAPGEILIRDMGPSQIRGAYVLYIGAGAVAAGGIISLFQSLPTIWGGVKLGLRDLRRSAPGLAGATPRTERDLPMIFVLSGIALLVVLIRLAAPLHMNWLGAIFIIAFGFLFVTVSSRLTGEIGASSNPISGMTVATLLLTCLIFYLLGWTGPGYYLTALSVGGVVCVAAANAGATSQDLKTGFLVGATPRAQQIAILVGAFASALILGPILIRLNDVATVYVPRTSLKLLPAAGEPAIILPPAISAALPPAQGPEAPLRRFDYSTNRADSIPGLETGTYLVDSGGTIVRRVIENFPATLRTNPALLEKRERLRGTQARADSRTYRVWNKPDDANGPARKYLVDDAGTPVYIVDPGINGTYPTRPDGTRVTKFEAPKATLMSYIIKGILNRQLPWGLVLIGVMIAIVLQMSGVSALAFAVGVYLPLSTSTPILAGGLVRWLADRSGARARSGDGAALSSPETDGDRSPGVLLASGYIAGGAIAGIVIAFMAGVGDELMAKINDWATAHNPFFNGPFADALSLLPFLIIMVLLLLAGRGVIWGAPHRDGGP